MITHGLCVNDFRSSLIDSARLRAKAIRLERRNMSALVAVHGSTASSDARYPASASIIRTRLVGRISVHPASIASRHS